jgi:glycosyltransferase involved in cell wall biosynthesis
MALGIPAIVSPVGVNTEIVAHGKNGLVADSDAAWLEHLKTLILDSELRHRLGAEARKTVVTRYSACVVAPKVAEIFRQAAH